MVILVFRGATEIGWLNAESREDAAKKLGFTENHGDGKADFHHPIHKGDFFIEVLDEISSPGKLAELIHEMDLPGEERFAREFGKFEE